MNLSQIMVSNSEKIINRFGDDYKLTKNKKSMNYKCPFCYRRRGKCDNDYKMGVDIETTMYHCFKCNASGIINKIDKTHIDSIISLIAEYFKDKDTIDNNDDIGDKLLVLKDTIPISKNSMAYEYLQKRGISDDKITFYNLRNGIGEHFGRIIIPNKVIVNWTDFYQARSYLGYDPKYKNPYNIDKSKIVFNLHNQSHNQSRVYICEGVFSAIGAGKDAIAIYGSSISDNQIEQIAKYNFKEIFCCLDGDSAGQFGQKKLIQALIKHTKSDIYTVKLPKDEDPCDMGEKKFKQYCETKKQLYINETINAILDYFN